VSEDITNRLVRVGVVAEFLSVAPYTVYSLRKRGLPFVRVGGRGIRFDLAAVRRWLDDQRGVRD
jgi:excisionase family DNA binding protein